MHRASPLCTLLVAVALSLFCAACGGARDATSSALREVVDSLNQQAYEWHYRDIHAVHDWASRAYELADSIHDDQGMAEAMNNLAFERFQQMDFDSAQIIAEHIGERSSDAVELLIADVMLMKVAQRTSDNLAFFRHRSHALKRIAKLERRESRMSPRTQRRFDFARSDLHIVASTYFYYLDQQDRAIAEIRAAEPYCRLQEDTAQWLYYQYMRGSGGLSEHTDPKEITREEFDYLLPCFWMARREGYTFFEANTEQSLAMLFADSVRLQAVRETQPEVVAMLAHLFNIDDPAMAMADSAFEHFVAYDDLYQQACALRTLGEMSFNAARYDDAIRYYDRALACVNFHHQYYYGPDKSRLQIYDPQHEPESVERQWMRSPSVRTVPEWIAGIRQQLSVAFSALDMKVESDFNRNIYLDLLDVTREDAELESRAAELQAESRRMAWTWAAVGIVALLIGSFILLLLRTWRRRTQTQNRLLRQRLQQIRDVSQQQQAALEEEQEQLREQQAATELRLLRDKQQNVEKRAKLQLVEGIQPFLNRIIHEVDRMKQRGETSPNSLTYIAELTERINEYNDLLTQWIQMQQGQLSLQLTSFELEPLFDAIRRSRFAYDQKGLKFLVQPTDLSVKADRALTLFMLNTLADNARKFTPEGGQVTITAAEGENDDGQYVELSVQDTGCGMTDEDVELILSNKVYDATKIGCSTNETPVSQQWDSRVPSMGQTNSTGRDTLQSQKGFGFGLMNCKGIIEKYRKTSPLFAVCRFGIDSRVGEGSRFWFRLPRVATLLLFCILSATMTAARYDASDKTKEAPASTPAAAYLMADSVYYCNLEGRYDDALVYAQKAYDELNSAYQSIASSKKIQLSVNETSKTSDELLLWRQQAPADYTLLLGLRNEVAVAALALHDWPLYRYNNRIYTQLFKLTNQDTTLEAFCQKMERSQANMRLALFVLIGIFLLGLIAAEVFYIHPRVVFRRKLSQLNDRRLAQIQHNEDAEQQRRQDDFEMAEDEHRRRLYEESRLHVQNQIIDNCLSTIKHETMYYPGRIQQLVERMQSSEEATADLAALSETVSYYRDIHALLSAQASSQSEALNFRRHRLSFNDLVSPMPARFNSKRRNCNFEATLTLEDATDGSLVMGDADLIAYLLSELFDYELSLISNHLQKNKAIVKAITLTLKGTIDNRFVRFTLTNPIVSLSDAEVHDFFMPHEGAIPLLIAKQIIREHDTFMGHPGCRINAERVGEGHAVWFTLPMNR